MRFPGRANKGLWRSLRLSEQLRPDDCLLSVVKRTADLFAAMSPNDSKQTTHSISALLPMCVRSWTSVQFARAARAVYN
jgi:hypothetical protein